MLSIAVCDDDELHRKRTVALIRNTPGFENSLIREFSRAENLLDSISEDHYLPDVAVLDIQMDEMDGIELAMRLNRSVPECQIIFLTGYIHMQPAPMMRSMCFMCSRPRRTAASAPP